MYLWTKLISSLLASGSSYADEQVHARGVQ